MRNKNGELRLDEAAFLSRSLVVQESRWSPWAGFRSATINNYLRQLRQKSPEELDEIAKPEFVDFLTDIVASQPAGKAIHVIVDNLSAHKTKLVDEFLAVHSNVQIEKRKTDLPGLSGADLTKDQQAKLLETMRRMLVCFRADDVTATMKTIEDKKLVERLFVSCYGGSYDIGNDRVWDTWQIEGPEMVWYFRGVPHIHAYFHLAA